MLLIIALGNIGAKYELTRHNAGFLSADFILNEPKNKIEQICDFNNQKFKGALYKARLNGESALILKPATFMNLSGEAALAVCNFYKPDKIAVLHDDLDLPLGALRFKFGGGSGGHNGLKSLDSKIGSEYYRVRIGIGKPENKSQNEGAIIEWVLSEFKKEELEIINPTLKAAAAAASELCFIENPQELNNKISNKFSRKGASLIESKSANSIESKSKKAANSATLIESKNKNSEISKDSSKNAKIDSIESKNIESKSKKAANSADSIESKNKNSEISKDSSKTAKADSIESKSKNSKNSQDSIESKKTDSIKSAEQNTAKAAL